MRNADLPDTLRLAERSLLSLAEAAAYARVAPSVLAGVPVAVTDPWKPEGSLVERRVVDAWWREQVLARPTR
jgi:hypothetical protein